MSFIRSFGTSFQNGINFWQNPFKMADFKPKIAIPKILTKCVSNIYIFIFFLIFFFLQSFHFKIEIFQQRVLFNNSFIILLASYYSLFICSSGLHWSIFLDEVGFRIAPKKGRSPTNLLENKRINHLKKSSVLYVFCVFC